MQHHILYDDGHHKCVAFSMPHGSESVPSNQFMIMDGDEVAILDPGGDLTFTPLTIEITRFSKMEDIRYIVGSHQDPDILASMPRWLIHIQDVHLLIPALWERFLPHYNSAFTSSRLKENIGDRIIGVPDEGAIYPLGNSQFIAIPAHFLHSVGNIQFYDPVSRILFSGDMGASLVGHSGEPVNDFKAHVGNMEGFHRRYMNSKKVTKLWADAVRQLDVEMMVPQHGRRFDGQKMYHDFLDWISELDCGVDLMTPDHYDITNLLNPKEPE